MKGGALISSTYGPFGQDVDTLVTVLRHLWVCDSRNFVESPYTAPVEFNESVYSDTKALRIGFYTDNSYFVVKNFDFVSYQGRVAPRHSFFCR